jgi:hypothetical protein
LKAKEWAEKFNTGKPEEFLKDYAEETSKLIAERTKGSGVVTLSDGQTKTDTKPAVVDGVLREQRQKWQAICSKVGGSLTTEMFEVEILGVHLPAVVTEQRKWAESKNTKQGKKTEVIPKGESGRKLADALV